MEASSYPLKPYILVAPNGARRGHGDHPALPVTTEEIIATAVACHKVGANGLHLHIRDDEGQHSLDPGRYKETLAALKDAAPELDIQVTTEAAGIFDVPAQLGCLRGVKPAWASISVREIARAQDLADEVYGLCETQGTKIQHILYDAEDAKLLARWQSEGIIRPAQVDRLLVLGRYADGQKSVPADLDPFIQNGTPTSPWMICAFGPAEHACLAHAAALGADVRVGFENSLTDASGNPWPDNAASVAALSKRLQGEPA